MLAVKVGAAEILQRIKGDPRNHRGAGYIWQLSYLGPIKYVAFETDDKFGEEWKIQDALRKEGKHLVGEWFNDKHFAGNWMEQLQQRFITDVDGRTAITDKWERKMRHVWVYDHMMKKWISGKPPLIRDDELLYLIQKKIVYKKGWSNTKGRQIVTMT